VFLRFANRAVARIENRVQLVPAFRRSGFDLARDRAVQQQCKEERRRDRLARLRAFISILETLDQKLLDDAPAVLVEIRIGRRQQRAQEAVLTQDFEALRAVAGQKQLQRFVEETRGRDVRE
jgi:hypothetical protein